MTESAEKFTVTEDRSYLKEDGTLVELKKGQEIPLKEAIELGLTPAAEETGEGKPNPAPEKADG
jgi:hypothetical protein